MRKYLICDNCNMGIVGQVRLGSSSLDKSHALVNVPKDTCAFTCFKLHRAQIISPGREVEQSYYLYKIFQS